ncbi:hypothetical protein ATO6_23420 [Oceanicola sp. 22II-s10i]|uniref:TRAP transporter large permease n=1 Tax=Oceanicola sp. 22II-s10i TaxID=1317116 RepID=UPI000B52662E|nr:TRAP transporter large permease [Oceanicola sp. 22II-s10i]OWU81700.1 hypothetical protein ATO6_23420 [Oceanicola sp. 22II-s10i]
MDPQTLGIVAFCCVIILIFIGVPIGAGLLLVGSIGLLVLEGLQYAQTQLLLNFMDQGTKFVFVAIPLYVLMGQLVFRTGLASDLYGCVYRWVGRLPGGLAIASVIAAAGFGAVSGGSATAVATLGPMCMPEMRRFKYNGGLAAGCIASAGTLGILIPPSIFLISYGIWTETSIGALFLAGIVPGLLMTLAYSCAILIICIIRPEMGPAGERFTWREKFAWLAKVLPVFCIFLIITVGIYGGIFDPTEAGAFGLAGVLFFSLVMRRLKFRLLLECMQSTLATSMMIFVILFGGHLISRFLVLTDLTSSLVIWISGLELSAWELIAALTLMYIVLGMLLDIWAMLLLTIPFVVPAAVATGLDPIWFGIYIIVMCELAAITPPVGLNVYIMARAAPEVPVGRIFLGVTPFFLASLGLVVVLMAFPNLVLWLPNMAAR